MAKAPKQLLLKLQEIGYGRNTSATTDEGTRGVLQDAIVEAIVNQERVLKAQEARIEFLAQAVKTHLLPEDELNGTDYEAVLKEGKGREPVSMPEVRRVVDHSQIKPFQHEDFGLGSPMADNDDVSQLRWDTDKG